MFKVSISFLVLHPRDEQQCGAAAHPSGKVGRSLRSRQLRFMSVVKGW